MFANRRDDDEGDRHESADRILQEVKLLDERVRFSKLASGRFPTNDEIDDMAAE